MPFPVGLAVRQASGGRSGRSTAWSPTGTTTEQRRYRIDLVGPQPGGFLRISFGSHCSFQQTP